jgi:general secretion pathway protein B
MSSILKALRRLEEERARKSPVAPEIAASLLRRGARRRPVTSWIWPTVLAAVVVVAAALLWSWRPAPVVSPIVTSLASSTTSPGSAARQSGEVIIEEVIDQRRPVLLPPTAPVSAPKRLPAKVDSPRKKVKSGGPAPTGERRRLVISAIAWQDDSSARMAVVDGLPVMTGEFVGTAKVQEILRDRILFAEAGKLFTVSIDPQ